PDLPGAPSQRDDLAALVASLSGPRSTQDRRISPRVPYTACIAIELPPRTALTGFARDLSRGGIAFVMTPPVPLDVVRLPLPPQPGRPPLSLAARVVRCSRILDGFYDVAARFLNG